MISIVDGFNYCGKIWLKPVMEYYYTNGLKPIPIDACKILCVKKEQADFYYLRLY